MRTQVVAVGRRQFVLESVSGVVESHDKRVEQYTESQWQYSDGSSGPVHTRTVPVSELFIRTLEDGREIAVVVKGLDIQARPGHRLTLVSVRDPAGSFHHCGYCYNHELDQNWQNWMPFGQLFQTSGVGQAYGAFGLLFIGLVVGLAGVFFPPLFCGSGLLFAFAIYLIVRTSKRQNTVPHERARELKSAMDFDLLVGPER